MIQYFVKNFVEGTRSAWEDLVAERKYEVNRAAATSELTISSCLNSHSAGIDKNS
jgi:hypothetical protein